ncbi:placenta-expressed transcript 1 protein-like [Apteryx mantelli]|uniref:Placenta-expressed transcript 1 protein n=1 Tax=Apteryx mantelli TaxID=2696672 RepID=A0ABM4FMR8_9AVES
MASLLFMLQLLFLGTLIVPAYLQMQGCDFLPNVTAGNFSLSVIPETYAANTTYTVQVSDSRNLTGEKNVIAVLLQALSSQNISVGEWKDTGPENCSGISTAVVNATNTTANWTSPSSNITSVEIRAYILFSDNTTELNTVTLNEKEANATTAPPTSTPNSISAVQSSTTFVAIAQVVLLFVTSKLLS